MKSASLSLPLAAVLLSGPAAASEVTGRYIEARTASVFAGACHYGGEVVTRGRDAVLGFAIDHGRADGVDLAGVRAMAVVSSDENLAAADAPRRSIVVVDRHATKAQTDALLA